MNASPPAAGPVPFPASPQTAEQLRAFFMECRPACPLGSGAGSARVTGLVDIRDAAVGIVALPAPPWSDPELRFLVRPEIAERLMRAASVLPDDVRLGFWEGLRPLPVQCSLWETGLDFMRRAHPNLSLPELEMALEPFVARPDGVAPPHSTGSAVDVAALDVFKRVLSPSDAWGRLGSEILARALESTGMARYEPEWWHWSYGDHEWARAYDCQPLDFTATPEFDGPGGGI